jgi:purine-binding chemotaxis protein CheW
MPGTTMEMLNSDVADVGGLPSTQHSRSERIERHNPVTSQAETATPNQRAGKYLTFMLGHEEFAIRVIKVREIMGIQNVTAVPQTPNYVRGVINLRGRIIPVVDLRLKFCMPMQEYSQRTCIIVVLVQAGTASLLTGIVVDEVSEVLNLSASDVEDSPDFGDGADSPNSYLLGMAKVKGKVKILLDIDRVLASQEIHGLSALTQM